MTRKGWRGFAMAAACVALTCITVAAQSIGGVAGFDITVVEQEAYWYSRYNLGHLTMRSGMGEVFLPEPAMVERMIAMADADPTDGDTVVPPTNPALLRTVFAAGDPHWTQGADSADFATMRWDETSFDTRVTGSALGWTIIKELEWAKQFHVDSHFGRPEDAFGAQWRFTGLALLAMAKMQATAWMELRVAGEMAMVDDADPFVMLMAISNLAGVLGASTMPHSASNRYQDSEAAELFRDVADEQFDRVIAMSTRDMSVKELATAIQGLVWYAATTYDGQRQSLSLKRIEHLGVLLIDVRKRDAADIGYALRGLIEVHRVTGRIDCFNEAAKLTRDLARRYDEEHGVFTSQNTYSIDDVAAIVGGLNAVRLYADADGDLVEEMLVGFFEGAVNLSGLQQSVPPIDSSKSDFEQDDPEIYYGYFSLPLPGEVGEFGIAPVFAFSVTFDRNPGMWAAIDRRFDTAGAMHAANEFIWMHADQVNGFPEVERINIEEDAETRDTDRASIFLFLAAMLAMIGAYILTRE